MISEFKAKRVQVPMDAYNVAMTFENLEQIYKVIKLILSLKDEKIPFSIVYPVGSELPDILIHKNDLSFLTPLICELEE
jgi:hypothetical protein